MNLSVFGLLFATVIGAPTVKTVQLNGQSHSGLLQQMTNEEVQLLVDGQPVPLASSELQAIEFPDAQKPQEYDKSVRIEIVLTDGTLIYCTRFNSDARTATLESPVFGEASLPLARVSSVRLGQWESQIDDDWQQLKQRKNDQDLLIVRKGDALDFAGGVVGSIGDDEINVLIGERELKIPRERVFGFVFPREASEQDTARCTLVTDADDRLRLKSVEMRDEAFAATLIAGTAIKVPADRARLIDFGLGRIRYLTELDPVATYEAVGLVDSEHVLKYRRVGIDNDPLYRNLVIGRRTFNRGLWIHSGSVLKYRLNRDFSRLQGVLGINRSSYNCARFNPGVHLQLLADGRVVFDEVIAWDDDPRDLDLDVAGVRDLEIRVAAASDDTLGICEHLAFADARLIK